MRFLLDTCVVSELTRREPNKAVLAAVGSHPAESLFISVLTLGEISKGIALLDSENRRGELRTWVIHLEREYSDRVVEIDADTAQIWGELTAAAQKNGRTVSAVDGLIAASARRHGFHVMTRNVADFEPTGVLLVNPWEAEPSG